ncbi:hypothetical protein D3C87_1923040 [compost metagenome]
MVGDLLAQKRLVRLGSASLVPPGAYFVVVPTGRTDATSVYRFTTWLADIHVSKHPNTSSALAAPPLKLP